MSNSLWKKVALGTAIAFGGFAVQAAPANAISSGFSEEEFKPLDNPATDPIDDKIVSRNSQTTLSIDFNDNDDDLGNNETLTSFEYQITEAGDGELEYGSGKFNVNSLFGNAPTKITETTDQLRVEYGNISVDGADNIDGTLDNLTYLTGGSSVGISPDDAFADVNFSVVQATTSDGTNLEPEFDDTNVDLEGEVQAVPFEAETSFGLITVAGFFGYRKFRQYKAKRNNESVGA